MKPLSHLRKLFQKSTTTEPKLSGLDYIEEIRKEAYSNNAKASDEMHMLNGTERKQENNELIQRRQVKNTPFEAINKGDGWFIGMSPFILTPTYKSIDEAMRHLERNKWNIIINVMTSLISMNNDVFLKMNKKE